MAGIEKANGHSAAHLLEVLDPMLATAPRPKAEDLGFDLDAALAAIVGLQARVPPDAFTATMLGTERQGNGLLIDDERSRPHHRISDYRGERGHASYHGRQVDPGSCHRL